MSENIKKKEDAELRRYEKRSLVTRTAVALGTLILSGLAGFIAGKSRSTRS